MNNDTEGQPVNPFVIIQDVLKELAETNPNYRKTTQDLVGTTHMILTRLEEMHQELASQQQLNFQHSATVTMLAKALEEKGLVTQKELEAAAEKYVRKPMEEAKKQYEEELQRQTAREAGLLVPDEKTIITPAEAKATQ